MDARRRPATRSHFVLFALLTISAGLLSGLAAASRTGPFDVLRTPVASRPEPSPRQLDASSLFPPVGPVTRVIDVYDPPRKASPAPAARPPGRAALAPAAEPEGGDDAGERESGD